MIFFQWEVKHWLEIQSICAYIFGVKGNRFTKLCHMTFYKVGMITNVQRLGVTASSKFGRTKTSKNLWDFTQLSTLTASVSGTSRDIEN